MVSIDYGQKRTGIAVTDELQLIANGLATVPTQNVFTFLENYCKNEHVETFIVGMPLQMNNTPSESVRFIEPFIKQLKKKFPHIPVETWDERFTSKMALQTVQEARLKKKDRKNKALLDVISATILLQSYMEKRKENTYK